MATTDRLLYIGSDGKVRQLGFDPAATDWAGGGGSSGGVTSASIPVALACTANDLMIVQEDGAVRPALASAGGLNNEINTTAGPNAVLSATSIEGNTTYGAADGGLNSAAVCELGNGDIACVFTGNGSTLTTGVRLHISSPSGVDKAVVTPSTTDVGCYGARVAKLTSTTFVLAYCLSSTSQIKFGVFNNDGTTAVAFATVGNTVNGSYVSEWALSTLANGDFILAYASGTNLVFGRYNSSAVLQGSAVTVEASATPNYIGVMPLAGGGFWVVYQKSTVSYRFGRYNASGTLQGALTDIASGNIPLQYGCDPRDSICELPNGNVVICGPNSTRDPDLYFYNSSGTLLTSVDLGTSTYRINQRLGLAVSPSGGVACAGLNNAATGVVFATFSAAGAQAISATTVDSTGNAVGALAGGTGVILRSLGGAGYAGFVNDINNVSNRATRLFAISSTGAAVGTAVAFIAWAGNYAYGAAATLLSGGRIAVFFCKTGTPATPQFGVYNVVRRSVLGVATTTTAAGSNATISFSGAYTINQDMSPGAAFDHRTQAVPGAKGFVIKQSAVMLGVS